MAGGIHWSLGMSASDVQGGAEELLISENKETRESVVGSGSRKSCGKLSVIDSVKFMKMGRGSEM